MHEQLELDLLFNKIISNYKSLSDNELTRLVQLINYKYSGNDLILSQLTRVELISCLDAITRATYELTKRKGLFDTSSKHYILSNLAKVRVGLESSSRKEIFAKNNLLIENEIDYRGTYILFKFFNLDAKPILLLKHAYGYGSITNWIEKILKEIEENYLTNIGYNIIQDNISIYYRDIQISGMNPMYDKVIVEEDLKNPQWETIDSDWFEEIWASVSMDPPAAEPIFIQKNHPYTAYKKVKEILNTAHKKIELIDPYIDGTLFSLLEELNYKGPVCVITEKFQGDSKILYEKYKRERSNLEIQINKGNHDRYVIIDRKFVYLFGSSINSIGNKSTTIVPVENETVKSSIIEYFDVSWNKE
ncbi:hypothetical protein [Niallia sp. 03133]|uniref:hypothetical protein n=1 Tax=Niallia sp. 03133 TaxID=3458060 RepID=UPI0040440647